MSHPPQDEFREILKLSYTGKVMEELEIDGYSFMRQETPRGTLKLACDPETYPDQQEREAMVDTAAKTKVCVCCI